MVASLASLHGTEEAATRLKSICETYANASSVTFSWPLGLSAGIVGPLSDKPGGRKPDKLTLVVKYEQGKPEQFAVDGAELFRYPNDVYVGRLGDGEWRRLEAPSRKDWKLVPRLPADATALDRLLVAAIVEQSPLARLKEVQGEIREAAEGPAKDGRKLEAWLNGHAPRESIPTKEELRDAPKKPPGAENSFVAAIVDPDGSVRSFQLGREVRTDAAESTAPLGWGGTITLTPSGLGTTTIEVPPAVAELAAKCGRARSRIDADPESPASGASCGRSRRRSARRAEPYAGWRSAWRTMNSFHAFPSLRLLALHLSGGVGHRWSSPATHVHSRARCGGSPRSPRAAAAREARSARGRRRFAARASRSVGFSSGA